MSPTKNMVHFRRKNVAFASFSTLIFIGIIILIQLISIKHNKRWDLTQNKRYSLTPQTKNVLDNLSSSITAYSFYNEDTGEYEAANDLFEQYKNYVPSKFSFQFINLDRDPLLAQKYSVNSYDTTVFVMNDLHRKVTSALEKDFTNAIVKLTRGDEYKKIYSLTLHGEKDLESMEADGIGSLKMTLEDQNYRFLTLNLMGTDNVPVDCDILLIAGPDNDPVEKELDAIEEYISTGGKIAAFLEPGKTEKLAQLFEKFGIIVHDDMILDPNGYQHPLRPIVEDYGTHEITESFDYGTIYETVRSITSKSDLPNNITIQPLAKTGTDAYGKKDFETLESDEDLKFNEKEDHEGPLNVGVLAVIKNRSESNESIVQTSDSIDNESRIIVFGDSDWINNIYLATFPANAALAYNIFHWLAEEKDLIAIPSKDEISQSFQLNTQQILAAFWIPVIFIPVLILLYGGVKIHDRRKRG